MNDVSTESPTNNFDSGKNGQLLTIFGHVEIQVPKTWPSLIRDWRWRMSTSYEFHLAVYVNSAVTQMY